MKSTQSKHSLVGVYLRGMAMGAADVVPGVSGGTIALISGIYDRFIHALTATGSVASLQELSTGKFKQLWVRADLTFLLTLFVGILTSVVCFAHGIDMLITNYPQPTWAFFFGLVLASAWVLAVAAHASFGITLKITVAAILGALLAFGANHVGPQTIDVTFVHFFIGGAICICAMILPGVSGSFLLLMLGLHAPVLHAVKNVQLGALASFSLGCALGLLSFSHLLSWCLKRYPAISHSFLIGLMLGALEGLWPWRQVLATRLDRHGETQVLLDQSIWPWQVLDRTGQSAQLLLCALAFILAFFVILGVSRLGRVKAYP